MKNSRCVCPKCGKDMLFEDTVCPFCGQNLKKKKLLKSLSWILSLLLILSGLPEMLENFSSILPEPSDAEDIQEASLSGEPWYESLRPLAFWLPQHMDLDPDGEDMRSARQIVSDHLQYRPASRADLIDYLSYQDYLPQEAAIVVDSMELDFQHQALLYLEDILKDTGGFSHQDLVEQLTFHGYTQEEVRYAMSCISPDYRQQAEISAADYLDVIPFSRQGLLDQLLYHGFSQEDALYAVEHCGADWQANAIAAAREQMEGHILWEEDRIRDSLRFHGFTEEEIETALKAVSES